MILELQEVGEDALVSWNPKAIVVEAIFKNLDFAIANLPAEHATADIGRVTKVAVLALKSRVHLYHEQYAEVISAVNAVTQMGYNLLPLEQWADQFLAAGENNSTESIFEVQYTGNTGSGTGSNFNNNAGIPQITGGGLLPTQTFADSFEDGDPRKGMSILFPGDEFAGITFDPADGNFGDTGLARKKNGYSSGKYWR